MSESTLRVSLVFAPDETFQFTVDPQLGDDLGGPATLEARLYRHHSSDVLWQTTAPYDAKTKAPLPHSIFFPKP